MAVQDTHLSLFWGARNPRKGNVLCRNCRHGGRGVPALPPLTGSGLGGLLPPSKHLLWDYLLDKEGSKDVISTPNTKDTSH